MIDGNKESKIGLIATNNQGCLMKIVEYNNFHDITIEFQDVYKAKIHTNCTHFFKGDIRNPYFASVLGVGMIGNKYPAKVNGKDLKEYKAWHRMLERCYDKSIKRKRASYKNVTCCDDWLLYENFYEWLHEQENFDRWYNGRLWAIDKDILIKGNKIYSPETCCLVPLNVNNLFVKAGSNRGSTPIGVHKQKGIYLALCNNPLTKKQEYLGAYSTPEDAFLAYKTYKEDLIKQIAELEYSQGNITKQCYEAMMSYEVKITD